MFGVNFFWTVGYKVSRHIEYKPVAHTAGPASYSLPPVLGHNTVATSAAPTFSFCGRSKNGSFHEDLKKVHVNVINKIFPLKKQQPRNPVIYFCPLHCCFPSRLLALLPTKLWILVLTAKNLPGSAWQAATSHLVKPQRSQGLVHTILSR